MNTRQVNTKQGSKITRSPIVWIAVLVVISFLTRPLLAASPPSSLDLARIDAFVSGEVQRHGLPGLALGIVEGDKVIHAQGFGIADQTGRPVTGQTPFLLASVSKSLTSLAIMQLVEAGQVELDAPVQRYLPEFHMADAAASAQITVRQLLLHTSGIPDTSCDTRIDAQTLQQYVAELQTVTLSAPPGTRYDYCSGNYNVIGRIIEVISGESYGAYMQKHVFAPLDMRHSFVSEQEALQDGLAQGYEWVFGLRVPTHYAYNPSQLPSGFLISSAEDMGHFLIAQMNGGRYGSATLLSPEGIAAMHTPGVSIGPGAGGYGMGWIIGELGGVPALYHYGANYEYHTLILIEPQQQRGAIFLVNANNAVAISSSFKEIEEGVARLLAGQDPAPASPLSFGTLYLLLDLPFALLLVLALWPLVRMPHWIQVQRERQSEGHLHPWRIGLRIAWEIALPLILLIGARLVLTGMGAQSWFEGWSVFIDVISWIWIIALILLLTGSIRFVLFRGLLRQNRAPQSA